MYIHCTQICFTGAGDVRFSLKNVMHQNNGLVTLEDIGEGDDALLCITDNTACCGRAQSPGGVVLGDWYYPNRTIVPNNGDGWNFYRNRGSSVVRLNKRGEGVTGIYHCVIPDTVGADQTIYIGVYTASTGELYIHVHSSVQKVL